MLFRLCFKSFYSRILVQILVGFSNWKHNFALIVENLLKNVYVFDQNCSKTPITWAIFDLFRFFVATLYSIQYLLSAFAICITYVPFVRDQKFFMMKTATTTTITFLGIIRWLWFGHNCNIVENRTQNRIIIVTYLLMACRCRNCIMKILNLIFWTFCFIIFITTSVGVHNLCATLKLVVFKFSFIEHKLSWVNVLAPENTTRPLQMCKRSVHCQISLLFFICINFHAGWIYDYCLR